MFGLWSRFPNRLGDDKTHEQSTPDESFKLNFRVEPQNALMPEIGRVFDGVYDQIKIICHRHPFMPILYI